ncbi:MAG: MltA domain-containing protein [Afipia sp.]|nr:MltA domain-containing protein [Afipia sp.]
MAPRAATNKSVLILSGAWLVLCVVGLIFFPPWSDDEAQAKRARHHSPTSRPHVNNYRDVVWPLEISGGQYAPLSWSDVAGWSDDDPLPAFKTFRDSCKPIAAQIKPPIETKALGTSLRDPCRIARGEDIADTAKAREFFEKHFVPLQISRIGEDAGFVTGYYEPVVEGSRTRSDLFQVPVYRRPSNLFVRGFSQASTSLPNKGDVFRKIGRRKLVPYYDRAEIEDGAIAGRGLEVVWLKSQTDLLFIQIQGSARVRVEDGSVVRLNYEAHNGYGYTPVGRVLIDRGIIPKDQMSMQKIREYMEQDPDAAKELRRQNRSYVFFREVQLTDKDEAVGAQGIPLTAGRSIAVDKSLHVYGTPFFISGNLPIESEKSSTPFRRLMVAQDTGSAIVGPARADIYFGAGVEAGKVAGRLKNPAQFAMLLPRSLDPVARGKTMPLPADRPSEVIAKLFPRTDVAKDQPKESGKEIVTETAKESVKDAPAPQAAVAPVIPLPEARPKEAPAKVEIKNEPRRARTSRRSHARR